MVLVDTSVWVEYLGHGATPHAEALQRLIDGPEEVCLTGIVATEVLQGIRVDRQRLRTLAHLKDFPWISPLAEDYVEAAAVYRRCRQRGVTVRGTIDCLIAALCLRRDAGLLHHDRDFDQLAGVVPLRCHAL